MIKELKTKLGSALQSALGTAAEVARDSADPTWIPFLRRWMILSLVLHAITAVFSVGHHSADEYFQILEFLNYKLGQTPVQDLPVEFPEMMRPWLQPAIYYVVAKLWLLIGVSNPFTWALSFRMFAGFAGWLSTVILAVSARYWFEDRRARRFAVVVLALIWFFPALHVRPSSESMGGSAFLIGIGLASLGLVERLKSRFGKWAWIFVGACFGLSFEGRFQMALMVVGALAWLLLIGRAGWARFKWIGCGGGAVFLIGRAVDAWGYGAIVVGHLQDVFHRVVAFSRAHCRDRDSHRLGQAPQTCSDLEPDPVFFGSRMDFAQGTEILFSDRGRGADSSDFIRLLPLDRTVPVVQSG